MSGAVAAMEDADSLYRDSGSAGSESAAREPDEPSVTHRGWPERGSVLVQKDDGQPHGGSVTDGRGRASGPNTGQRV